MCYCFSLLFLVVSVIGSLYEREERGAPAVILRPANDKQTHSPGLCVVDGRSLPLCHVKVPVVLVEICPSDKTMEISLESVLLETQTSWLLVKITLEMERAL